MKIMPLLKTKMATNEDKDVASNERSNIDKIRVKNNKKT